MDEELLLDPSELDLADHHPRSSASTYAVQDLVRSIRFNGQLDPIEVIRQPSGRYAIHDGARRTLACLELGFQIRARVIPSGTTEDMFLAYAQRHRVRRPVQPGAVHLEYIYRQIEMRTGSRRRAIAHLASAMTMKRGRVVQLYEMWALIRKRGEDRRAIAERWSYQNILVALGGPAQRERKGKVKRPLWSAARPESVAITRDDSGAVVMTCRMPKDATPEELRAYYQGRRWPRPELVTTEKTAVSA